MFGQISQGKTQGLAVVLAVVEMNMDKVADQDIAGEFNGRKVWQVSGGLLVGQCQILASGFHLDEEQAGEKTIDPAMTAA